MSKSRAGGPKKAYVTYIGAGNEDEKQSVVGLAKGLRRAQSKYPLVVAILSDLYAKDHELLKLLGSQGCSLEKIDPIPFPKADDAHAFNPSSYFKLGLWKMKGYDRMVYLNADVQVYDNIDCLMNMNVPKGSCFAVTGCFCEQTETKTGTGTGTGTGTSTGVRTGTSTGVGTGTGTGSKQPNTYSFPHCQNCPNTATGPGLPSPLYFNLGLVVFQPDPKTYDCLLKALQNRTTGWLDDPRITSKHSRISLKDYWILDTSLLRYLTKYDPKKAKVVQYLAVELKPWKKENKLEEKGIKILGKKWLDIYNDKSLDVKNKK